jgi:glycerol-3-phosphate dehydrogenase
MSDKKQTAVEWLVEQLPQIQQQGLRDIWEQAKEMEKQQIIEAYRKGFNSDDIKLASDFVKNKGY